MLGDNYKLDLTIEEEKKELYFNFQTLKNLYKLTQQNPFYYLQDFMFSKNRDEFLGTILYCMANGDISLTNINSILEDVNVKNYLLLNMINIITVEFKSEYEEVNKESEKDSDEQVEKNDEEKLKEFENYWNSCYFTATILLKKSEDEFYKMSVRELQTLAKYNKDFYKNVLIDTYVTVLNAKNGNYENERKEEVVNVGRLSDMFR